MCLGSQHLTVSLSRSAQKQEMEEVRGIKIPVFVHIFKQAALKEEFFESSE